VGQLPELIYLAPPGREQQQLRVGSTLLPVKLRRVLDSNPAPWRSNNARFRFKRTAAISETI